MYEFTRLDSAKVHDVAKWADELWVPARFVQNSFRNSGVDSEKLKVLPESVDTHTYNPQTTKRHYFPPSHLTYECTQTPTADAFNFLSDFKWEPRKGWDVLIDAYYGEFTAADSVTLYIVTHIWFSGGPETYGWPFNITQLLQFVKDHVSTRPELRNRKDLPTLCIVSQSLSTLQIAQIYASCDAFVFPTRGEGWGLPAIQAMAMAKATIATNWGGNTQFMNSKNSFLIQVDGVEEVPLDSVYGWSPGKKWALPSVSHTSQLMRYVTVNRLHAMAVGKQAREDVVRYYSEEKVAEHIHRRLLEIRILVEEKRRMK